MDLFFSLAIPSLPSDLKARHLMTDERPRPLIDEPHGLGADAHCARGLVATFAPAKNFPQRGR